MARHEHRDTIEKVLTGEALAEREAAKTDDDALRRLVRRGTRRDGVIVAAVLALAAFVLFALHERTSESDRADRSSATALDLATQVQAACAAGGATAKALGPACADSKAVTVDKEIQRGEQGLPGRQGVQGAPGPAGPKGDTVVGPKGDTGAPGSTGPKGDTVVGPKGDTGTGQDGRNGTDGTDGSDGKPGADGRDGAPGQPPLRWTFAGPDGTSYTCDRASDFSASAPTYTCTAAPAAAPEPPPVLPNLTSQAVRR